MDLLLHSCTYFSSDGTRKLIDASENCLVRTNKCFWNADTDIVICTKTRSMTKNEGNASLKTIKIILRIKKRQ